MEVGGDRYGWFGGSIVFDIWELVDGMPILYTRSQEFQNIVTKI